MKYVTIKQRDNMRTRLARTRVKDLEFLAQLGLSRLARKRRQAKIRERQIRKDMGFELEES